MWTIGANKAQVCGEHVMLEGAWPFRCPVEVSCHSGNIKWLIPTQTSNRHGALLIAALQSDLKGGRNKTKKEKNFLKIWPLGTGRSAGPGFKDSKCDLFYRTLLLACVALAVEALRSSFPFTARSWTVYDDASCQTGKGLFGREPSACL